MQLYYLSAAGLGGFDLSGPGFYIAIALLACLLGALIAGICILINKAMRAAKEQKEDGQGSSATYHYGAGIVMLGAIPQSTYALLSGLAWAVAVVAIAFLVMLIVLRVKGYLLISSRDAEALKVRRSESLPEEHYSSKPLAYAADEAQKQEEYTPVSDEPFGVFAEETADEPSDETAEAPMTETTEERETTAVQEPSEILPAAVEQTSAPVVSEPGFADGTQPYKIVEKIVTETQKEIVREVPAQSATKSDSAAEQLMEKLTDFLDYELQKRKEADLAEEVQKGDVPTSTKIDPDFDEEDEDDEDELDENDELSSDEENDIDDEEPDGEDRFTGNERIIGFDEATGCYIVAHYRKSFEAKLIQSRPRIKQYYSELKNALLSYKGNKSRISWAFDSFNNGREQIAKINVKTNIVELYLAIDPETLEDSIYHGKNVGHKKKYAETPFLYKLRTPRKFKWAMELVQRTCEEHGLSPIDIEKVDYEQAYPFESTESLVARKLIKEYIREEKPATTFELAPDHVPTVPDEDESVIPANANFSWEFDNEMLEQKEEMIEELSTPEVEASEPEPAPEEPIPAAEPAPEVASEPVVVRETVKVTEMRYTERYYGNSEPVFEQTVTTTEPIEMIDAPTAEEETQESFIEDTEEILDELSFEEPIEEYTSEPAEEIFYQNEPEQVLSESEMFDDVFGTETPTDVEMTDEFEETDGAEEYYFDEPAEDQPAEEEYAEEEYTEEEYTEEEYTEEEYTEEEYTEEEYTEEEYTEEEYTEEGYTEEEYAEEEYAEEEYAEEEYAEEEYVEEEYVEEEPAVAVSVDPAVAVIDICAVADAFEDGDTVSLESLKAKGLVLSSATMLKIYATGELSKALSVEANHFTLDAIYAISSADGDTSMIY